MRHSPGDFVLPRHRPRDHPVPPLPFGLQQPLIGHCNEEVDERLLTAKRQGRNQVVAGPVTGEHKVPT